MTAPRVAVAGASEPFGLRTAQTVLAEVGGPELAVIVWSHEAPELLLPGVEVRTATFDDPVSIARAFTGIERAVLPSTHAEDATRLAQHVAAVTGAVNAGVEFIAYTGVTRSHQTSLEPARVHAATEAVIVESGISHCFLRNNMYTENELRWVQRCLEGEPLRTAAGDGRVGWASRDDYADAAARVLTGSGHEGRTYEFGGRPMSYRDLADVVAALGGHDVTLEQLTEQEYSAFLQSTGMAATVAGRVARMQTAMAAGDLDEPNSDLADVLGREPETMAQTLARLTS